VHRPLPAAARLRTAAARFLRRAGLVPGGDPDGLGEDADLGDLVLPQQVVVFFPEPPRNAYQLVQWLGPLENLDRRRGVVIITQDSRTTALLRERTSLAVHCVARSATLDGLVARGDVGLVLYVSHHPRNFQMLRFGGCAHVYLGHGESDKAVSASNQLKAYDRVFVAAEAAVDRILGQLLWFDADRLVQIGRPQAYVADPGGGERRAHLHEAATVLYAPTWEGAQPSMAYSSVLEQGEDLVRSLLAGGFRVVYRPHPRTGANRADVARADQRIRRLLGEEATAGSRVDTTSTVAEAFADADALVTDVSSLAVDWLPTGRPLVVTAPATGVAPDSPLLDAVPRISADGASEVAALVRSRLEDDVEAPARAALARYHLGETGEGGALTAFLEACDAVLADRAAAVEQLQRIAR
jgi:hypothetical protein